MTTTTTMMMMMMMDEWILSLQTFLNASTLCAKKEKKTPWRLNSVMSNWIDDNFILERKHLHKIQVMDFASGLLFH